MKCCKICAHAEDRGVEAVAMCSELRAPLCAKHAAYCVTDGHTCEPLPAYESLEVDGGI